MTSAPPLTDAELLSRLVGFDSTSQHSNLPIADFICTYLDRPGLRIERNPSAAGDKVNLVISTGPEVDPVSRAGLVLCGHMDVVPATEPEWQSNPFELVETSSSYVGRGACDMKGFLALAINLAAQANPSQLDAPLVLLLTYDEEVGTLGGKHFVDSWPFAERPVPRRTIIGEPTSLAAVRLHKGHAKMRLTVRGVGAHSGYPHLGENAIEPAARAIVALGELRQQLEDEAGAEAEHFPQVPFVALNIATVAGGSAVNIVPEECQVELGFRVLPGMQAADIEHRIHQVVTTTLGDSDWQLEATGESPPLALAESNDLYQMVCQLVAQENTASASFATDGGWLQQAAMDCLLFGPGTIEVAHKPNEFLPKDEFRRAAGLLRKLCEQLCGSAAG